MSSRRESLLATFIGIVLLSGVAAVMTDDDDRDDTASATPASSTTTATTASPTTSTAVVGEPAPVDHLNGFVPAPLAWEPCGGDFECAGLAVPVDWSNPGGPTITLAVSRLPATGDEPLGALATNPGGPGSSGNGYIRSTPFDDAVSERYDVLSWDPRGVGESAPLGCEGEEVDRFLRLDSDPDDGAEQAALEAGAQAVAAACQAAAPHLLPFVGTTSVARDLEAIRRAYGGPMAYYGFSYGTAIGLHHLQLFPGAMTRVVLDGVVDPAADLVGLLRGQAAAFERALQAMFDACDHPAPESEDAPPTTSDECPGGGAEDAYDELAAELETSPLPVDGDRVGPSDLATAATLAAYDRSTWEFLYAGLDAALDGDGTILLALADTYRDSGAYDLYQAVSCLDSVNPRGGEAWAAFAADLEAIAPRLGAAIANEMLPCAYWPVEPAPVTGAITAPGSGPVLVIGTTRDPATPFVQAQTVAAGLADGHLLVHDGDGHTAYSVSDCVQDRVAEYLIDGRLPADGEAC